VIGALISPARFRRWLSIRRAHSRRLAGSEDDAEEDDDAMADVVTPAFEGRAHPIAIGRNDVSVSVSMEVESSGSAVRRL